MRVSELALFASLFLVVAFLVELEVVFAVVVVFPVVVAMYPLSIDFVDDGGIDFVFDNSTLADLKGGD